MAPSDGYHLDPRKARQERAEIIWTRRQNVGFREDGLRCDHGIHRLPSRIDGRDPASHPSIFTAVGLAPAPQLCSLIHHPDLLTMSS